MPLCLHALTDEWYAGYLLRLTLTDASLLNSLHEAQSKMNYTPGLEPFLFGIPTIIFGTMLSHLPTIGASGDILVLQNPLVSKLVTCW